MVLISEELKAERRAQVCIQKKKKKSVVGESQGDKGTQRRTVTQITSKTNPEELAWCRTAKLGVLFLQG